MNCDSTSNTAVGASGQRPELPRFLVLPHDAKGRHWWYILDTLLGQTVGDHHNTEDEAHTYLLARFGERYGVQP